MPSSKPAARRSRRLPAGDDARTWVATLALTLVVYLTGLIGYVPVQGADGNRRWERIFTLVHLAWDTYPAQAPVFLPRLLLLLLVLLAVPAGAYLIVASWRLRS